MIKYSLIYFIIFLSQLTLAQEKQYTQLIQKGLTHVLSLQKKENSGENFWKGEWPSDMMNLKSVIALGPKGKTASDSNCFTTALVHNELVKYVLRNNELSENVAHSINLAIENILTFKTEKDTFNFWHKLPMTDVIKDKASIEYKNQLVSRPNNYPLTNTFAAVRSNIADDADDTAVAYSATYLNQVLNKKYESKIIKSTWGPVEVENIFNEHRDLNRNAANPFNRINGIKKNTGAYLTWLSKQNSSFMGSVLKGWKDDLRIPEGSNNVDCIVNANVLQMFSHYGFQNSEGSKAACRFIEDSIDRGIIKKCGVYYPNPYHLHFSVSQAYEAGAECLKSSAEKLFADLKQTQNANGSWSLIKKSTKEHIKEIVDPISSSVYAGNAFFTFAKLFSLDLSSAKQADLAADYIAQAAQTAQDGSIYWKAGVFFSGGTFVRKTVVWKSEAYTTMLAVQALDRYQNLN